MPVQRPIHWNPPESVPTWSNLKGKSRCGRKLRDGGWTEDQKDVTCDTCLRCLKADMKWGT